ncbi:amidohydrolase family protein [Rodentibacter trehalosifermentans]|uniref:amidohydrolase family protein n=1 Tax=Rodentibacter trehalosifermentans TaxID=1908263 RepID=UPI0009868B8B|nr:amidohydrolase family protein [Rodentibacter trehalosifermentans]OOF53971.1 amidohydrolase [Rodentibacter trehalosifermentans]
MKLICVEEHILDPNIAKATMPQVLQQAPYLTNWGKRVKDGNNPDHSRPQIEKNDLINPKGMEFDVNRLADMDAANIDMQVLSVGGFPQFAPLELHQQINDKLAEAIKKHPNRFAAMATLPWAEPEQAAEELERAVKQLGLKGALLNSRPSDDFLDHPRYEKLLAKFDELNVPLYLHPGIPVPAVQQAYYSGFDDEVTARLSMFGWGWHNEAGIHLLRLMLSGAFDRYPNLQVISGHWGEMLPFYLQRLDDSLPQTATGLKRSLIDTFKQQVFVSPSGMLTQPHFQFIYDLVGAERILFSVDYPYQTLDGVRDFLENLPISQAEKELIAYKNAEKLFGIKA